MSGKPDARRQPASVRQRDPRRLDLVGGPGDWRGDASRFHWSGSRIRSVLLTLKNPVGRCRSVRGDIRSTPTGTRATFHGHPPLPACCVRGIEQRCIGRIFARPALASALPEEFRGSSPHSRASPIRLCAAPKRSPMYPGNPPAVPRHPRRVTIGTALPGDDCCSSRRIAHTSSSHASGW